MTSPSARRICAYGVVRCDRSGTRTGEHIDQIRRLAGQLELDLRGVLVTDTDAEFARLLASFEPSGIAVLLVPHVVHVAGWMDAVRDAVDVWSLKPLGRWPRWNNGHTSTFQPSNGSRR